MNHLNRLRIAIAAVAMYAFCLSSHAAIISTSTQASMQIEDTQVGTTVGATDSGAASASVSIDGPRNSSASVNLTFDSITNEAANLDFNINLDGGDIHNGQMIPVAGTPNKAVITYAAMVNSVLDYSWDFGYSGSYPFGLGIVRLYEGLNVLETLGNQGIVGAHTGSNTFNLVAGNVYVFGIQFFSNVSGSISDISGTLAGDVSFNFNGTSSVPEPSTFAILGLGLAGICFARRKKTQ